MSTFNTTDHIHVDDQVLDSFYNPKGVLQPRDNVRLFVRPFNKDQREPWSIPISLFKDYKDDHKELEDQCFEEDWTNLKCPCKEDADTKAVKKELRKQYEIIR